MHFSVAFDAEMPHSLHSIHGSDVQQEAIASCALDFSCSADVPLEWGAREVVIADVVGFDALAQKWRAGT